MKKQQKPFEWGEDGLETSDDLDEVLDGLEGLDDMDEEDIIDLDDADIVELTDELADDGNAEEEALFGADDDKLGLGELEDLGLEEDAEALAEEDFLNGLDLADEEMGLGEDEHLEVRVLDENGAEDELGDVDFGDLMGLIEEDRHAASADVAAVSDATGTNEDEGIENTMETSAAAREEASSEEVSVEDLISGIESRLMDLVQQFVEARLPDIVREVLREEIAQLKEEMESVQDK
jgi:hypothetical protein